VFYHLTYEGSVDLEDLRTTNEELYGQYMCQIAEFGQTPTQLFLKPHPQRELLDRHQNNNKNIEVNDAGDGNGANSGTKKGGSNKNEPSVSSQRNHSSKLFGVECPMASIIPGIDTIPYGKHNKPSLPTKIICKEGYQITNSGALLFFAVLPGHKLITVDAARLFRKHDLTINPADMKPAYILKLDKMVEAMKEKR
jgi:hypothetical protein